MCFIDLCAWCRDCAAIPAAWLVVWALSPACKPVAELGGLFWANAVLETQSTAPIAHAIEKCFMPVFLSVRRGEDVHGSLTSNKRTLTCLLKHLVQHVTCHHLPQACSGSLRARRLPFFVADHR